MQIYREFGQNATRVAFSNHVLIALTTAPDPQAALAEAEARQAEGESITAKQAKEIASLHKRIAEEMNNHPSAISRAATRLQFRARLSALIFKPGPTRNFAGGYHIHLEGVDQLNFRRVDGPSFRGVDRPVNRTPMKVSHGGHDRERINTFPIFQRLKNAPPSARIIRVQTGVFFEKCFF